MNNPRQEYEDLINSFDLGDVPSQSLFLSVSVNHNKLSSEVAQVLLEELVKEAQSQEKEISRLAKTQIGRLLITKFSNIPLGLEWWTSAAEEDEAVAQNYLGGWYLNEDNAEFDLDKAVFWLTKAADQGHAKSQHTLGAIYAQGLGVTKDIKRSTDLFEKAAEQGYIESQLLLATLFLEGSDEVSQNTNKALRWLEKASEQDDARAQYQLAGLFYDLNEHEKAYNYYLLASTHEFSKSQLIVAMMQRDGDGVTQDINLALNTFLSASKNPDLNISNIAKKEIGCIYLDYFNQIEKTIFWWEQGALDGNFECQYNLALTYSYGDYGIEIDTEKARKWVGMLQDKELPEEIQQGVFAIYGQILKQEG